jgi:hypothetical protein
MGNLIAAIWGFMNGKKMNTGTTMLLAVFVLKQIGMGSDSANNAATQIMLGVGSVLTIWGYIHKLIKNKK